MTLKVADFLPAVGFASEVKKWWAHEITARTGGKVKLRIFRPQSRLKGEDMVGESAINASIESSVDI